MGSASVASSASHGRTGLGGAPTVVSFVTMTEVRYGVLKAGWFAVVTHRWRRSANTPSSETSSTASESAVFLAQAVPITGRLDPPGGPPRGSSSHT